MYALVVFTLSIDDVDSFVLANEYTLIAYLTTHLTIERSMIEYKFIEAVLLLCHLTITKNVAFVFCIVITNKLLFAFTQDFPVTIFNSCCITGTCLLLCHLLIELLFIYGIAVLCADKFCQIEWETIGVEEAESLLTIELCLAMCLQLIHRAIEEHNTLFQCTEERILFFLHYTSNEFTLCGEFWISSTHLTYQYIEQLEHESLLLTEECISITYGTTKDSTDNVTCLSIAWQLTVGN